MSIQITVSFETLEQGKDEVAKLAALFYGVDTVVQSNNQLKMSLNPAPAPKGKKQLTSIEKEIKKNDAKAIKMINQAEKEMNACKDGTIEVPEKLVSKAEKETDISPHAVTEMIKEVNAKKGISSALKVLKSVGAMKFSDIPPARYNEFMANAHAELTTAGA